jgi:putative tryptophan/tyrosine transport system substrate-binding protein
MNRRILLLAAVALFVLPLSATAQPGKHYRVAVVELAKDTAEQKSPREAFRAAMRELGYAEGGNVTIEWRYADNDLGRLRTLVDEVIALRPDVLLGFETVAQIMRQRTDSIPIVLTGGFDPVRAGLARTLRLPGFNVTGSTQIMDELTAKHFEILRQIMPRLTRVGQLVDTTSPGCKVIEEHARRAAQHIGAAFIAYPVGNQGEIERAFARMEKERPDALLPCPSPVLFSLREILFQNAVRLQIPFTSYVVANLPLGVLFLLRGHNRRRLSTGCHIRRQDFQGRKAWRAPD